MVCSFFPLLGQPDHLTAHFKTDKHNIHLTQGSLTTALQCNAPTKSPARKFFLQGGRKRQAASPTTPFNAIN